MGITVSSLFIGHPVTTYTTTVTVAGGFASSDTTSTEGFQAGPNQWGQAGVQIKFYNEDTRDIKYVKLTVFPFNQVRDVVGGIFNSATLTVTGPIKAHHSKTAQWDYVWDGSSISSVSIGEAEIVYFDGTSEKVSAADLHYDRALRHSPTIPITLVCSLLLCTLIPSLFSQYFYDTSSAIPCQPILFFIMLLFPLVGIFFSRRLKNRPLAIASAAVTAVASAAVLYPYFAQFFRHGTLNLNGYYYNSVAWSYLHYSYSLRTPALWTSPEFSLAVGGFVMAVLLLLCSLNVFRKNPSSISLVVWGICCLASTFTTVAFFVAFNELLYNGVTNISFYLPYIMDVLFFCYLSAIAIRFRTDYSAA